MPSASSSRPRLGAYVLPADPAWLRSSLLRYLPYVDDLVVPVPADGCGWLGRPVSVDACLAVIRDVDQRGVCRVVTGRWTDRARPRVAEVAQRQAALDALETAVPGVDWILQIDNDEVLPDLDRLLDVLEHAGREGLGAVEWPMRVLYRQLRDGRFLEVADESRQPRYEYPGPIALRPGRRLVDARRSGGDFLRPLVIGDQSSTQVVRAPEPGEVRADLLKPEDAILHNSWARDAAAMHQKVRTTSHRQPLRTELYYWWSWRLAPLRWRRMRDFHPLFASLWPRLWPVDQDLSTLVAPEDLAS